MSEEEWFEEHKSDIQHINDMVDIVELQQENKQLKQKIEQQTKICLADHKYASSKEDEVIVLTHQRDLYKEVIEEAKKYIKEHIRVDDEYPAYMEMLIEERDELLQILDKTRENK